MNNPKTYNGKVVFTTDTFNYDTAEVGNYVDEAVVDYAINCLPPACMSNECSQMGEPYSHELDSRTGKWRPTYATFKRVAPGIWEYCGHCFRGETTERGTPPVYCC